MIDVEEFLTFTELYLEMKFIVEDERDFDDKWDDFWNVSNQISDQITIEWSDPDTSYEEDIMARWSAVKEYMSGQLGAC